MESVAAERSVPNQWEYAFKLQRDCGEGGAMGGGLKSSSKAPPQIRILPQLRPRSSVKQKLSFSSLSNKMKQNFSATFFPLIND